MLSDPTGAVDLRLPYLLIVLFAAAVGYWSYFEPFGRDQGIHATIAFALREGLATYGDVYNVKPPLTTGIHWLSQVLFGHDESAIRLFDLVAVALTGCALARLLALLGYSRFAATLAPITLLGFYYSLNAWSRAQTDGWAGFLAVLAVFWLVVGWRRRHWGWFFLAGVAMGLAIATKYTVGAIGLVVFAPLLVRDPGARFSIGGFVAFVAGGATALGAVVVLMWSAGVLGAFLEIQEYVLGYASNWRMSLPGMIKRVVILFRPAPVAGIAVLIGLALLALRPLKGGFTLAHALFALWIPTAFLSYWVQAKGFSYHALPFFVAAAGGTVFFWEPVWHYLAYRANLQRIRLYGVGLAAMLGFLPLVLSGEVAADLARQRPADVPALHNVQSSFSVPRNIAAAKRLNEILAPDDTLFLWGYETLLYFQTNRPPVHRYPYAWPFVVDYYDGRYTVDLIERLAANPPDVVVVQFNDATPWVTGDTRDSRAMLADFTALDGFLKEHYRLAEEIDGFDIWRFEPGAL